MPRLSSLNVSSVSIDTIIILADVIVIWDNLRKFRIFCKLLWLLTFYLDLKCKKINKLQLNAYNYK